MTQYFTLRAKEGGEIDPWAIDATIEAFDLKILKYEQRKNDEYLITTEDNETAEKLETLIRIDDGTYVEVSRHASLNGSKGVIKCPAIRNKTEEVIQKHLEAQKVTRVQARGENGTFILTFDLPQPPKEVKVGALMAKVATFYPRPMLCKNCYIYGHTAGACRNNTACPECGQYHEGRCPPQKCRNCGGGHHPTAQMCKVWRQEMAINRMMVDRNIPAIKARATYKKDNKKTYIVPPKAAPEARKIEPKPKVAEPSGQSGGTSKATTAGLKRKSAPTPLVAIRDTSSESSDDNDDEEVKAPPKKAPPAKKGKGKAAAAGRANK